MMRRARSIARLMPSRRNIVRKKNRHVSCKTYKDLRKRTKYHCHLSENETILHGQRKYEHNNEQKSLRTTWSAL